MRSHSELINELRDFTLPEYAEYGEESTKNYIYSQLRSQIQDLCTHFPEITDVHCEITRSEITREVNVAVYRVLLEHHAPSQIRVNIMHATRLILNRSLVLVK